MECIHVAEYYLATEGKGVSPKLYHRRYSEKHISESDHMLYDCVA